MGLLDAIKRSCGATTQNSQNSQLKSKYEHLPLVNPQEDKKSSKGYVERKFITEEKLYIPCDNIFYNSNIPIINACESATKFLQTTVLQNKNGSKVRSVIEIIYFSIPQSMQENYINLITPLNDIIQQRNVSSKYLIKLRNIKFTPLQGINLEIPLSHIEYEQDKKEFRFIFATEYKIPSVSKEFEKYSSPIYDNEELGCITYDENGTMKKAYFYQGGIGKYKAKINFKNYKSGFDLYDIRCNEEIIYKRETK